MAERRKDAQHTDDERRAREAEEMGHEANVNQVQHEPVPASHQEGRRQEAVARNEEHAHDSEERRQAEERR